MSNGWAVEYVTLSVNQPVGASQTNTPITVPFRLKAQAALHGFVLKINFSSSVVATGVTAKLQTAIGADWVDSKTATVTNGAPNVYIKLNNSASGDQTYFPLLAQGRVVLTTQTGDSVVITHVELLQAV